MEGWDWWGRLGEVGLREQLGGAGPKARRVGTQAGCQGAATWAVRRGLGWRGRRAHPGEVAGWRAAGNLGRERGCQEGAGVAGGPTPEAAWGSRGRQVALGSWVERWALRRRVGARAVGWGAATAATGAGEAAGVRWGWVGLGTGAAHWCLLAAGWAAPQAPRMCMCYSTSAGVRTQQGTQHRRE